MMDGWWMILYAVIHAVFHLGWLIQSVAPIHHRFTDSLAMNRWIGKSGGFESGFTREKSVIFNGKIGDFQKSIFHSPIHFSFFSFFDFCRVFLIFLWKWIQLVELRRLAPLLRLVCALVSKTKLITNVNISISPIHFFYDFSPPLFSMFFFQIFDSFFFRKKKCFVFFDENGFSWWSYVDWHHFWGWCVLWLSKKVLKKKRFMAEQMNRWIGDRFTDSPIQSRRIGE